MPPRQTAPLPFEGLRDALRTPAPTLALRCTVVIEAPDLILPGKTAPVVATFEAPKSTASYSKGIVLKTKGEVVKLNVSARIGLPLRVSPRRISFTKSGETQEKKVTVHNDGPNPVKLIYSTSKVRGCIARVPREAIPARGKIEVPITFSPKQDVTADGTTVYLRTNVAAQRDVPIRVSFDQSKEKTEESSP